MLRDVEYLLSLESFKFVPLNRACVSYYKYSVSLCCAVSKIFFGNLD